MLAIRRAPADHDTQACCLGPTLCHILIQHFYHEWYIVAIPDLGFVYYLRDRHRCDQEQSQWLFMNSGSQTDKKKKTWILSLLKFISCYYYALFLDWVPELALGVPVLPLSFIFTAPFWNFISVKAGHILINTRLLMSFLLYWGR